MWRPEAGEGGHEINAAVVGDLRGEFLDVHGLRDEAETVAQPLHDGAADEDRALERVVDPAVDLPGDGGEEVVF
jgi:hypothetical protein